MRRRRAIGPASAGKQRPRGGQVDLITDVERETQVNDDIQLFHHASRRNRLDPSPRDRGDGSSVWYGGSVRISSRLVLRLTLPRLRQRRDLQSSRPVRATVLVTVLVPAEGPCSTGSVIWLLV